MFEHAVNPRSAGRPWGRNVGFAGPFEGLSALFRTPANLSGTLPTLSGTLANPFERLATLFETLASLSGTLASLFQALTGLSETRPDQFETLVSLCL